MATKKTKKEASSNEQIIATLQKRVDAGTAGANDKKRLETLLAGQAKTEDSSAPQEETAADQEKYKALVEDMIASGRTFGNSIANELFDPSKVEGLSESVSPEVQATIDAAKLLYDNSLKRTAEDQLVLDKRISGLEGYTAEENAALREAMRESLTRDRATSQRELMRASGGNLTAGALAGQRAGIDANFAKASANQGRDLLIANVDEKQKRLESLSAYAANLDTREFAKRKGALDSWTAGEQSKQGYETMAQQYNQSQRAGNTAGRAASILGGIGTYTGLLGGVRAEDAQNENLKRAFDFYQEMSKTAKDNADAYQKSLRNYTA